MRKQMKIVYNRLRGYAAIGSVHFPLDYSVISPPIEGALAKGSYERAEVEMACAIVRPGDVVLELGAGLGYVSASIRHKTAAGRIVCYEANPHLISYIKKLHAVSRATGIDVRHAVVLVSPSSASISFHLHKDIWAGSLPDFSDSTATLVVSVPTVRLHDVIAEVAPDVLVMDIEGAEIDILEADGLGSVRRMVVELHPDRYGSSGTNRAFAALKRHGFGSVAERRGNVFALER